MAYFGYWANLAHYLFCLTKRRTYGKLKMPVVQPVWFESLAGFHTPGAAPASVAQRPAPKAGVVGWRRFKPISRAKGTHANGALSARNGMRAGREPAILQDAR